MMNACVPDKAFSSLGQSGQEDISHPAVTKMFPVSLRESLCCRPEEGAVGGGLEPVPIID
jgi:hypothetical protein